MTDDKPSEVYSEQRFMGRTITIVKEADNTYVAFLDGVPIGYGHGSPSECEHYAKEIVKNGEGS